MKATHEPAALDSSAIQMGFVANSDGAALIQTRPASGDAMVSSKMPIAPATARTHALEDLLMSIATAPAQTTAMEAHTT